MIEKEWKFSSLNHGELILPLCIIWCHQLHVICMLHKKLKDSPTLQNVPAISVHLATGHYLCPTGLICYRIMIDLHARNISVCKNLWKDPIFRLDMQQLYQLGCDWTDIGCMFLHQSTQILINLTEIVTDVTHLWTISNTYTCPFYYNYTH